MDLRAPLPSHAPALLTRWKLPFYKDKLFAFFFSFKQAAKLLKLLSKDNVEYVRQGAHIATGILYMQRNETECPEVKEVREEFLKVIKNKRRSDKMARMGAILGSGNPVYDDSNNLPESVL